MKWKKSLFVVYALISTAFVIAFSYNLLSFARYIDDLLNTNTRNFIYRNDRLLAHIFTAVGCFLNFLFLFRKSKFSPSSTFWVLLIPVIIIDLTTFIEGRSLMPLRFPFSTLFPIFGLLGGFLKVSSSKRHFRIFAAFFILFTVISQLYFIPAIIKYMIKRDSKNIPVSPSVIEGEFITINGSTIVIKDTAKAKTILIEYYFVGCVACENKKPYLKKLLEKNQPDKFQVIFICNGSISNFAKFQTHARANDLRGATYLYRKDDESKNKYMPGGYPFEIMLNDKLKITSTFEGFNSEAGAMYVRETQEKINHSK